MRWTVQQLLVDLAVGNHLRRIEHPQFHARREQASERYVNVAFLQVALLHRFEVRGVVVVVIHLREKVDAFVVHAQF